ncbi:MAG: tetratricopeptide repeat protein [Deltaproteobacteria bacterium]|nr:tetratricopeptide repeat protein [Deltaproteobacteria bacterium]
MTHFRTFAVFCILSASAALAHAQAGSPLDQGKELMARGDCRAALARFEDAERTPSLDVARQSDALWYKAACLWSLSRKPKAGEAMDSLLQLSPLYDPSTLDTPPDVRAEFKRRRTQFDADNGVTLGVPVLTAEAVRVPVSRNAARVVRGQLFARTPGEGTFAPLEAKLDGDALVCPLEDLRQVERIARAGSLELVVEALGRSGAPVARLGDARAPVLVNLDAPTLEALKTRAAPAPVPAPVAAPPPAAATPAPAAPAAAAEPAPAKKASGGIPRWPFPVLAALPLPAALTVLAAGLGVAAAAAGSWVVLDQVVGTDKMAVLPALTGLATWGAIPAGALVGAGVVLVVVSLFVLGGAVIAVVAIP